MLLSSHRPSIRQVVDTELGSRTTSLIQPRRLVDGSNLEKISDTSFRRTTRCKSEFVPNQLQADVKYPSHRVSIDGSDIESISDNQDLKDSYQRQSLLANMDSILEPTSRQSIQNAPRRSRFINYGRRAPSNLSTPKRQSASSDSRWRSDSLSPGSLSSGSLSPCSLPSSPPAVVTLRPTPFQLPKLVIPDNGRPPVRAMRAEWLHPSHGEEKLISKPLPSNLTQDDESPESLPDSLASKARDITHFDTKYGEISPLPTPELSHNIRLPSALDFPDLSFTPQTDTSPIRSTTLARFEAMSRQQTSDSSISSIPENGSMSLFSAIYKILRNPSSAGSNGSTRFSIVSPGPPSPTNLVSPLFSARSPPRPLSLSRFSSKSKRGKQKQCNVCGDKVSITKFPIRPTARCRHESSTCQDCIIKWIDSCVSSGKVQKIKCPDDACNEDLSYADVEYMAPLDVFKRYQHRLTISNLSGDENFRWCINSNCNSGQIHEILYSGNLMRCNACRTAQCVVHDREWHYGESCQSYEARTNPNVRRRQEENSLSNVTILKTTKECPKCKVRIEKTDGCDHMRCSRCNAEFCWKCNAMYSPIRQHGNEYHDIRCKYHTRNIRG